MDKRKNGHPMVTAAVPAHQQSVRYSADRYLSRKAAGKAQRPPRTRSIATRRQKPLRPPPEPIAPRTWPWGEPMPEPTTVVVGTADG